jgi:hypothetical protein
MYFYALPTRDQAKRVAWGKIKALVPQQWIAKNGVSESQLSIRTVFGSVLYVVGMDKPQRIEGDQWDGGVVDESCDQKPGAFDKSIRPALTHKQGWCWRIGVPKRFGPGAADFKQFWDSCKLGTLGPEFEAYSWPSWDILPESEIEAAKVSLGQKDFEEQFGASWVSTAGLVFYAFDEALNVDASVHYDPSKPLYIGSDFNVDPMAWVVLQKLENHWAVIDELFIRNTNTQATLNVLHRAYGNHKAGFVFTGDASARARKTSAAQSDYLIIKNDTRFTNSAVLYKESNPAIADRFATTNAAFCNAANERRLVVHPRCVNLIKDLKTRAYIQGSRLPDDHGDIGHITDALGYIILSAIPMRLNQSQAPARVHAQSVPLGSRVGG